MTTPAQIQERLKGLVEAGIALSSELSLDELLRKLAETAAALTGARYAALGVIDPSGTGLERFVHTGIDAGDAWPAIGDLPRGRGILGALITDARPLRLGVDQRRPALGRLSRPTIRRCAASSACRSCSAAGAFGNLYLTEKGSGVVH